MKLFYLTFIFLLASSCMKSKQEYEEAITDVHEQRQEELRREAEDIQREEALERNPARSRGSNDVEGMGMDEAVIE